jgi:hypothetical protein
MRRRTGIALAVAVAFGAAVFAGCGGGDEASGLDTPAGRAAQAYVDAYNGKRFTKLCQMFTESYKDERSIGPGGTDEEGEARSKCSAYFREHTSGASTMLTLESVETRVDTATAHVRSDSSDTPGGQSEQQVGLQKQPDGTWLVNDVTSG